MGVFDEITIGSAVIRRAGPLESGHFAPGWVADSETQTLEVDGFVLENGYITFDTTLPFSYGVRLHLDPVTPALWLG